MEVNIFRKKTHKYFPGTNTLAYFPKNSSLLYATDAETQLICNIKFTTFRITVNIFRKNGLKILSEFKHSSLFSPKSNCHFNTKLMHKKSIPYIKFTTFCMPVNIFRKNGLKILYRTKTL